jgi:hypothetical protein
MWPPTSPATISLRASENAQHDAAPSQVKVASASPVSRSHTFSVLSPDADTARLPSGVTATPSTEAEWPSSVRTSPVPGGLSVAAREHNRLGSKTSLVSGSN